MERLKSTVFAWFPDGKSGFNARRLSGSGGHARRFARFSDWEFETEPGVAVRAQLLQPSSGNGNAAVGVLVVIRQLGEQHVVMDDEILPLLGSYTVLLLSPRYTEWTPDPRSYAAAERTAAATGRTLAGMQVWDVIRAVRWVLAEPQVRGSSLTLYGRDTAGIVALYAALFEERVAHVVLSNPPESHHGGPALLTVLRTTDIPEIGGFLAPRCLTVLPTTHQSLTYTRRIYELLGYRSCFAQADSLFHALRTPGDTRPADAGALAGRQPTTSSVQ
ncbi:MAG: hypothetical protein HS113_26745 [Verrucomicrobiales bacterium]|nr:hypothetical protein [Verrucomicrobiales bacterium]